MAILEAVVNQQYSGQLAVNRFHYVSSGTPASVTLSFALLSAMGFIPDPPGSTTFDEGTVADAMENIQNSSVRYLSAYARDLYSVTDFYEVPYPQTITGDRTGEASSPVLAVGFFSNRVRTDVRRGMKRFVGVSESDVGSGGYWETAFNASLELMAGALGDTLTYDDEGNTLTFVPAILGFEEYETPSGKRAYKKWADPAVQLTHTAQGVAWQAYPAVRTQVSRQYGRGA